MQTRNVWEVMEDRLRFDGFGVFSFDLGGLFYRYNSRPVTAQAEVIAEKIERITKRYDLGKIHIIGHSKGGLLARHYIQHHGGDRRVKSLITLGTPHHGTPTAAIGLWVTGLGLLTRSPFEMLPKSNLVKRLRHDTFPAHIPFTSIYSKSDFISPFWTSVLFPKPGETSMQNMAVKGVGHTALCHDPAVYLMVKRQLQGNVKLWDERSPLSAELK
jgi:triacylglycerol esterase/lipase EstA (alpha/beta hydrolase family)